MTPINPIVAADNRHHVHHALMTRHCRKMNTRDMMIAIVTDVTMIKFQRTSGSTLMTRNAVRKPMIT